MHTGHIRINGDVMSKSKNNFWTIKDLLKSYNSNQIRIFFLMSAYEHDINYTTTGLDNAVAINKKIIEFFKNIDIIKRPEVI